MLENVLAVFQQFQELTTTITTQHVEHPSVISEHGVKKKKKKKKKKKEPCTALPSCAVHSLHTPVKPAEHREPT